MLTATYYHREAHRNFEQARSQIWPRWLWRTLTGQSKELVCLNALRPYLPPTPLYRGLQEIPVAQVIGSVGRSHAFSRDFLPLRPELQQRWMNVYALAMSRGWPPIAVYQVGNIYFVEDGHHRVSVARHLGNRVIEAEVWAYPLTLNFDLAATPPKIIEQLKHKQGFICQPALC